MAEKPNSSASTARRRPIDWATRLADGPGLQACWRGQATAFVTAGAYDDKTVEMDARESQNDDTVEMTVESGKVDTKAG